LLKSKRMLESPLRRPRQMLPPQLSKQPQRRKRDREY
jgi:hypothetical protein